MSEYQINTAKPLHIKFYDKSQTELGILKEVDGKLEFEGNASESAKVFFDEICKLNCQEIKRLKAEIEELKK